MNVDPTQGGGVPMPIATFASRIYGMCTKDASKPSDSQTDSDLEKIVTSIQLRTVVYSFSDEYRNPLESRGETNFITRQLKTLNNSSKSYLAKGGALASLIFIGIPRLITMFPMLFGALARDGTKNGSLELVGKFVFGVSAIPFHPLISAETSPFRAGRKRCSSFVFLILSILSMITTP